MKKNIFILLLSLPLLFSCSDVIPEGERYEELTQIEPKRNVLIEDFTGQNCTNCPKAHKVIADLQELYGNYIVAVAIHADLGSGMFGIAEDNDDNIVGLMQPEGDLYAAHWGVRSLPSGLINRTSGLIKHTEWAAYSRQEFAKESQADIELTTEIVDGDIAIRTEVQSTTLLKGKLQLWITESNITAQQENGGTHDNNYIHHHVYRTSVNGIWGEEIVLTTDSPTVCQHTIALRDNWDTANLSIVAFVYTDTDGVLGVVEQHL